MIVICKASIEDAAIISELGVTTFYETYADYNTKADMLLYTQEHYSISRIVEEIKVQEEQYFIAKFENKPVGFAKMRNVKNPEFLQNTRNIEIERIYVLKQYQKLRAGKALIDYCIEAAKEEGFEIVWLGVWNQNLNAIRFYEKNVFEEFGTHNFLLGSDLQTDLVMLKKI